MVSRPRNGTLRSGCRPIKLSKGASHSTYCKLTHYRRTPIARKVIYDATNQLWSALTPRDPVADGSGRRGRQAWSG